MKLICIAGVAVDGVIGVGDDIPWHIPEDFKHFRVTTMGNILLVGATTFLTLPPKAHEGREFIILNSGERFDLNKNKYYQFSDLGSVMDLISGDDFEPEKVYVIGGASIYDAMIDYCDECVITWVNKTYPEGDKKFPIDKLFTNFVEPQNNYWEKSVSGLEYTVLTYIRKDGRPKKNN